MRDVMADLFEALSSGPKNFYDLEDHLIELGHDLGADPDAGLEALLDAADRIIELDDATVLDPLPLLSDVTFTVDFSESHDLLDHQIDLVLVELLAENQVPLSIDGEAAGVNTHDKGYRLHHQRWLHLTDPEQVTGFRFSAEGLEVTPAVGHDPEFDLESPLGVLLSEIAQRIEAAGVPVEVEPLLFEIASRGVFAGTVPPITWMLDDVGLECDNMMVVPKGFDWEAWYDAQAAEFESEFGGEGGVL